MWKTSSPLKLVCFLRITCHWSQNNLKLLLFIFFKSYAYWYSEQENNTFLKLRQVTLTLLDISLKSWIRLLQYRYVYDYWVINENEISLVLVIVLNQSYLRSGHIHPPSQGVWNLPKCVVCWVYRIPADPRDKNRSCYR